MTETIGTPEITTYWAGNRIWSPLAQVLHDTIEAKLVAGALAAADNARLERFRRAKCVYYDIFNNGGCNYTNKQIRAALGIWISKKFFGNDGYLDFEALHAAIEPIMDRLVLAAAKEQGITLGPRLKASGDTPKVARQMTELKDRLSTLTLISSDMAPTHHVAKIIGELQKAHTVSMVEARFRIEDIADALLGVYKMGLADATATTNAEAKRDLEK